MKGTNKPSIFVFEWSFQNFEFIRSKAEHFFFTSLKPIDNHTIYYDFLHFNVAPGKHMHVSVNPLMTKYLY